MYFWKNAEILYFFHNQDKTFIFYIWDTIAVLEISKDMCNLKFGSMVHSIWYKQYHYNANSQCRKHVICP